MPALYKRYVNESLSKMPDVSSASVFLSTLNEIPSSLSFTMKLENNGKLPSLWMIIIRNSPQLGTYVKPTDTGLWLHYQSHVEEKYRHSLLKTMFNHVFKLSSNWMFFHQECELRKQVSDEHDAHIRIVLPFKDQKLLNAVRHQLGDCCRCPARLHKTEDQRTIQAGRSQTSNC